MTKTRLEELLEIIPGKIEHPILNIEWGGNIKPIVKWTEYKLPFILRIEKNNSQFSASYVYTGFEGETQTLPMTESEFKDYSEYGGVLDIPDRYKPTLEEALEELLCWLKKDGLIDRKND
jgi:hypothetical protein